MCLDHMSYNVLITVYALSLMGRPKGAENSLK